MYTITIPQQPQINTPRAPTQKWNGWTTLVAKRRKISINEVSTTKGRQITTSLLSSQLDRLIATHVNHLNKWSLDSVMCIYFLFN